MAYGYIADSLTVNGIQEVDLTDTQRKIVIHKVFMWYKKHPEVLNGLLKDFLELHSDDYDYSEPCECCGDVVTTYKMEI